MKAAEARELSEKNAETLRVKMESEQRETARKRKEEEEQKHAKFYADLLKYIRERIGYAVAMGYKSVDRTLDSSQWPKEGSVYSDFFGKFPYAAEVKRVIVRLEKDGYTARVVGECVTHDDSAAYLNSGGECGSETPWNSYDSILRVSWE